MSAASLNYGAVSVKKSSSPSSASSIDGFFMSHFTYLKSRIFLSIPGLMMYSNTIEWILGLSITSSGSAAIILEIPSFMSYFLMWPSVNSYSKYGTKYLSRDDLSFSTKNAYMKLLRTSPPCLPFWTFKELMKLKSWDFFYSPPSSSSSSA